MSDIISINYNNNIYIIEKEPFETLKDSYTRGWYIVKNYDNIDYNKLYSISIMLNNKNEEMNYFVLK